MDMFLAQNWADILLDEFTFKKLSQSAVSISLLVTCWQQFVTRGTQEQGIVIVEDKQISI